MEGCAELARRQFRKLVGEIPYRFKSCTLRNMPKIIQRPPIVVVLGHVDHGKSSILEAIKDLKITQKESGGITQHIGAYEIEHQGEKITFIDTPGHEVFSAMRSRGAKIADIAILVVAADEGVKEQTKEAISHIKNFNLPMIVAINKIDKPGADTERVKRELNVAGVSLEKMGGDTPAVEISAKTKQGIPDLLDIISLVSQMENLKADIEKTVEGEIIETLLDSKRGPLTTAIIKNGILKIGDVIGTESAFGRVKDLENFQGNRIKEAPPSMPVLILGFNTLPFIGETFKGFQNLEEARNYLKAEKNKSEIKWKSTEKKEKNLNIILKTDVLGSLEAIESSLREIRQENVSLNIVKSGIGEIVENDLKLAEQLSAKIIAFRVKIPKKIKEIARLRKITILEFDVIYDLIEKIEKMMKWAEGQKVIEEEIGKLKVLSTFGRIKEKQIIGGRVAEGEVRKFRKVKVIREEQEIGRGKISNLQRNKVDTDLVLKGQECGLLFEGDTEIQKGDILIFTEEKNLKNPEN